jgi:hypothetical protein
MITRTPHATTATAAGLFLASPALAAAAGADEGMGLLTVLLLAFGAIIILAQAVPAAILFVSMLKTVFSPARRRARADNADTPA